MNQHDGERREELQDELTAMAEQTSTVRHPYWIEEIRLGKKLTYFHVHSEGDRYPTVVETPAGEWAGVPGEYDSRLKVVCLKCKAQLGEKDRIQVQ